MIPDSLLVNFSMQEGIMRLKGHNTTLQNRNLKLLRRFGILNVESETNAQSPGEEQPVRVCASSAVYVSIAVPPPCWLPDPTT